METTTIQVSGMSCQGCVKSVTGVLAVLPGVRAVDVSLEDGAARVSFDGDAVSRQAMLAAIEDAGFGAA